MEFLEERALLGSRSAISRMMDARLKAADSLYQRNCFGHFGCVNAVEFSPSGKFLASGGDDRRVLLRHVARTLMQGDEGGTRVMNTSHLSNIFSLSFDHEERRIVSAGNDKLVIVHDIETGKSVDVFSEQQAVYCVSTSPVDTNLLMAACDNAKVLLFDLRQPLNDPVLLVTEDSQFSSFYSAVYNPVEPNLVATANSRVGAALYDLRHPARSLMSFAVSRYGAMSAQFSRDGTRLFILRRRLPPALYDLRSAVPLCQFDHCRYYNSCTMKSGCFAGFTDDYVVSGSDDFNIYLWRVPSLTLDSDQSTPDTRLVGSADLVLRGHRSIVNQVRFCRHNAIIASSGVEKCVKLWSMVPYPGFKGSLHSSSTASPVRRIFQHGDYLRMMVESRDMEHLADFSEQSVDEDSRMMAFFDTLVQRETAGMSTETESESDSATGSHSRPSPCRPPPQDADDCYFASSPDSSNSTDNLISQLVSLKRRQLKRLSRQRSKRLSRAPHDAQSRQSPSSSSTSSSPDRVVDTGREELNEARAGQSRRRLHLARYVWLPDSETADGSERSSTSGETAATRQQTSSSSSGEDTPHSLRSSTTVSYRNRSYRVRRRRREGSPLPPAEN